MSVGDGLPNTSLVLVDHGYSIQVISVLRVEVLQLSKRIFEGFELVSTANCWRICETNLTIQILVDGILPAAAQRIVVQSGSRNVAGARQS